MDNDVIFYDDYDFMMDFEDTPCTEIKFIIHKECDNAYSEYWRGYCNWYEKICNNTFNDSNTPVLCYDDRNVYTSRNYVRDTYKNECQDAGVGWTWYAQNFFVQSVSFPNFADCDLGTGGLSFWLSETIYKREVTFTFDVGGSPVSPGAEWIDLGLYQGSATLRKWARELQGVGAWTTSYLEVNMSLAPYAGTQWCENTFHTVTWSNIEDTITYTRFRKWMDVITYVAGESCVDITEVTSAFFNNSTNPVTAEASKINNMFIAQKSDIILVDGEESSGAATIGITTFQKLMQYINEIFQVYWFINTEGALQLEHISYWSGLIAGYGSARIESIDLTILDNGIYINAKNKYDYLKLDMPNRERWKFMEMFNLDFRGVDIVYSGVCTNQRVNDDIKERNLLEITTDLNHIQNEPEDISKEGFVMVVTDGTDVLVETGSLSGLDLANNHLSIANLQDAYWRYDRVILEGNMNNQDVTFESAMKIKKQETISFKLCCDEFDADKLIKTQIGWGEVIDATESLKTSEMKINLKF